MVKSLALKNKNQSYTLMCVLNFLFIVLMMSCNNTRNIEQKNSVVNTENNNRSLSNSQTKFQQGVDFYATGPDSSWTLEMDFEKDFVFKSAAGNKFSTPAVEAVMAPEGNVSRYRAEVESGKMIIQLFKQVCSHYSKGQHFPYRVTMEYKWGIDKEFKQFEGCGHFVFDERIHDIWVLQQLNEKTVTGTDLPYIEFNTTDGTVMGKTDCNNFTGKADFRGNKLTIGALSATRKICPNAAYESDFLKAMSPGEMKYEIENGKLFLNRNEKETIIFRKVD